MTASCFDNACHFDDEGGEICSHKACQLYNASLFKGTDFFQGANDIFLQIAHNE